MASRLKHDGPVTLADLTKRQIHLEAAHLVADPVPWTLRAC